MLLDTVLKIGNWAPILIVWGCLVVSCVAHAGAIAQQKTAMKASAIVVRCFPRGDEAMWDAMMNLIDARAG